jgi:GNAT superfamily N-acetyltransferase
MDYFVIVVNMPIPFKEWTSVIEIFELNQRMELFDVAVDLYWRQWGSPTNERFYYDCMLHSCHTENNLPRFYIAIHNSIIVGTYALLRNDLNSRQDLFPWLACLYVIPEIRGHHLGAKLLQHAASQASIYGFDKLYLCTDLEGYYEKYGWEYLSIGYIFNGNPTKIYEKSL